jgi:hypothetical protein
MRRRLGEGGGPFQKRSQPVISVDTKKKELLGDFKNGGREWYPKGEPEEVRVHDFIDKKLGKAIPYGVYDVTENEGWVSVGMDHDTARFAAEAIRRWWKKMGAKPLFGDFDALVNLLVEDADHGVAHAEAVRNPIVAR